MIKSSYNNNNNHKGMIDIMMIETEILETIGIIEIGIVIIRTTIRITETIIIAITINQTEIIAEVDKIEIRIVIIEIQEDQNKATIIRMFCTAFYINCLSLCFTHTV